MGIVSAINYNYIQWLVNGINQLLLKSECGLVLQITVNEENDVIAADCVPTELAIRKGFDPVRLMKGKHVQAELPRPT
jgi:hypothetical protein